MKVMDSPSGQGANRRHSCSYGEDLQRGHGGEDALSCSDTFGSQYEAHQCKRRPMTCEPDPATAIASMRGRGADQFDPVRLHFLETLARRTQEHQGAVKRLLEDRLSHALAQYLQRLARHEEVAGDVQRPERGHQPDNLAGLVRTLTQHGSGNAQANTDASADKGDAGMGFRPELKSIRNFRQTWSKLSVDRQLAQAIEQGPENAGPFNSHQLVLRALSVMRDIAPHYLNRFMSHADALLWLDQADGKPVVKSAVEGESGKSRKTSRGRAR